MSRSTVASLKGARPGRHSSRAVAALAAACLTLTLAGCFGSSSSGPSLPGADPASIMPASTLLYLQAVIRPSGSLASGIDAASRRLLGIADPGPALQALLDKTARSGVSYAKDIRPWLGARAAFAVLASGGGHAQYVVVLDQIDTAKAQTALSSNALLQTSGSPDKTTRGSYRGVGYADDQSAHAIFGLVGQFVVIANDSAAFDATVDVDKGASSLASVGSYQQSLAGALPGSAGTAYASAGRLFNLIPSSGTSAAVLSLFKSFIGHEILYGSARLSSSGALLDLGALNAPQPSSGSATASGPQTNPIGTLPAGSLLAIGATHVGPALLQGIGELGKLGGGTAGNLSQSLGELQLATGVNLQSDLSSITTAAFFVEGTSVPSLHAALLLGLSDPSRATTILGQLHTLMALIASTQHGVAIGSLTTGSTSSFTISIPGLSYKLVVAAAGGRIVIALDQSSLSAALDGGPTLASSSAFKSASELLGDGIKPSIYVDLGGLATLAKSTGSKSSVLGYVQRLGSLAVGTGKIGGAEHVRVALTGS
jgi:hypothetical protein